MSNKNNNGIGCTKAIPMIFLGLLLLGLLVWSAYDAETICESLNDIVEMEVKHVMFSGCFIKIEENYWTRIMPNEAMFYHMKGRLADYE